VRVPENAGIGIAKVTLAYPGWKDRRVTPAMFEIPVKDASPKQEHP
jgi:hypothetical protein